MADRKFIQGVIVGAVGAICIGAGLWVGNVLDKKGTVLSDEKFVEKLTLLENMIDAYYLNDKDEEELKEGVYAGLIYGLGDPYSRYYTAEEYEDAQTSTDGAYVGIGVLIQKNTEGGVEIVECYEGGPGEKAGLETGDVISAVDGTDITELSSTEVVKMIKDRGGEEVELTVHREGEGDAFDVAIPLDDVELPYVFHEMLDDETGYIRISEFTGVTYSQYTEAFDELEAKGMEKLVVDLRNNPGGLLSSVCDVLNDILPEGLIVYTEDKYGNREEKKSDGENPLEIPLAVLVNESSASASEIFAGAVQDYEIGTIVGTTTYGKGVVQSIRTLEDGSAVKLTVSNYYTPKGNNINEVGIEPDVEVKLDTKLLNKEEISHEEDNQLQKALEILEGK